MIGVSCVATCVSFSKGMGAGQSSKPVVDGVAKDGVAKSINIMILGKPGIGKSTLVNGLLGKGVAKISLSGLIETRGCTRVVQPYSFDNNGITGVVYDTPGLLDATLETDVIQEVKKVCSKVDLFLLCIRMSDPRIIEGDENCQIIRLLEKSFGKKIWEKTLVTLVFANELISTLKLSEENKSSRITKKFNDNKTEWQRIMKTKLKSFHGVIPTGHINEPKLLPGDQYHWLTTFWEKCLLSLPSDDKKAALIQLNKDRFTHNVDLTYNGKLETTQITITSAIGSWFQGLGKSFSYTLSWIFPRYYK